MILSLILLAMTISLNIIAAVGARSDFAELGHTGTGWLLPSALYAAAAVALAATALLRWQQALVPMRWMLVAGLVLSMLAPLAYGAVTRDFHLSHHLVRLVIVLAIGVIVWRA